MSHSPFSEQDHQSYRALYPHTQTERIYLNHAAVSPLSTNVTKAVERRMHNRSAGRIHFFEEDLEVMEECRDRIRRLVRAESTDRIAFVTNTSAGLNLVANGLKWKAGDRALINDIEFPANVYPFLNLERKGIKVDFIPHEKGRVTPEQVESHLRPETRLVSISAVQFLSGYRADLEAIGQLCRDRDILFVVDGIQALGAIRLDVQAMHIDALAAGGHKWLMGLQGCGLLYVSEALQNQITEQPVGWLSVEEAWEFFNYDQPLDPSARRYENGTPNFTGIYGLNAALETHFEAGPENVEAHIRYLTSHLYASLTGLDGISMFTPRNEAERAGIVTAHLDRRIDTETLMAYFTGRHLTVSIRNGKLRIAPHYYNTAHELNRAVEMIKTGIHEQL